MFLSLSFQPEPDPSRFASKRKPVEASSDNELPITQQDLLMCAADVTEVPHQEVIPILLLHFSQVLLCIYPIVLVFSTLLMVAFHAISEAAMRRQLRSELLEFIRIGWVKL
jgi:hypothetical protein